MKSCDACNKIYSSKYNLQKHWKRQPLCQKWIDLQPGLKTYVDECFMSPMTEKDKEEIDTKCFICTTTFSNIGNLNRHLDNNVICGKWSKYKDLEPLSSYTQIKAEFYDTFSNVLEPFESNKADKTFKTFKEFQESQESQESQEHVESVESVESVAEPSELYHPFVASKHNPLVHIIWNLMLSDKQFMTGPVESTQSVLDENNIQHIIAILPDKEIYKDVSVDTKHSIMLYQEHNEEIDTLQFDEQCLLIDEYRGRESRGNVLIFCNSGYQRSIPFLVYFLMKYHNSEAPTVTRAIDIILPQVDRDGYSENREAYIKSVTRLLIGKV